ncbi:5821_t:CDS:2, partial [Cetraspora pellucida]
EGIIVQMIIEESVFLWLRHWKTRFGFEAINMIDLEKIENFDIKAIHIFAQISYCTIDFVKRPEPDQTTKRYPHISEHVKLQFGFRTIQTFNTFQLDEYQRDQYLLTVILCFSFTLVSDEDIKRLNVLIVPICTGTAPAKIEESGKKHSEDNEEVKRKHAVLKFLFLIHTQKLITNDTALNNSTIGDHEVEGLTFLEAIDGTYDKAKAPLAIDIHHVEYKAVPALEVRKNIHNQPFKYNNLTNRKEFLVMADTNSNMTEIVDTTTGRWFIITQKRSKSADALTPHGDEQYKFSASIASDYSVHKHQ